MAPPERRPEREAMVREQIEARGVRDRRVLGAMRRVPRERFVPEDLSVSAYEDHPLPIGAGQTISQPYIVALMAASLVLEPGDRVLEVGAGSGYAAAVMGEIAARVDAVEREPELCEKAAARLEELGYGHVRVHLGDGSLGWPDGAPYDAIAVAAGGPSLAEALIEQLAVGGRLVMPVGETEREQTLVRATKREDGGVDRESLGPVRFVPLLGAEGWREEDV